MWDAKLQDHELATGAEHTKHLRAHGGGIADVTDTEADRHGIDRPGRERNADRICSNQLHARHPRLAQLGLAQMQHPCREVDADHASCLSVLATHGCDGEVCRARTEIEDRLAAREFEGGNRPSTPLAVEAGAQKMGSADRSGPRFRVEHRGDTRGILVGANRNIAWTGPARPTRPACPVRHPVQAG